MKHPQQEQTTGKRFPSPISQQCQNGCSCYFRASWCFASQDWKAVINPNFGAYGTLDPWFDVISFFHLISRHKMEERRTLHLHQNLGDIQNIQELSFVASFYLVLYNFELSYLSIRHWKSPNISVWQATFK